MIDNSVNIFFNKILFRFYVWKKQFEEDPSLLSGIHFYSWFCLVARNIDLDWWLHLVLFIYIYIFFFSYRLMALFLDSYVRVQF